MSRLSQWPTYEGLLAGFPGKELNQRRISELLEEGRGLAIGGCGVFLVPPLIRVREWTRDEERVVEERLPSVSCLARFDSGELEGLGTDPYSSLVVAWFQEEFGVPAAHILEHLRQIDWERHAAEWGW
jgi:hypothetical protein